MLLAGFAVSAQVSGWVAPRLALNAIGAITLVATAYLFAATFGAGPRSRGALAVGAALATWIPLFGDMPPPNITRGDAASPMLWSITLQSPDQGIRRLVPGPSPASDRLRLRVMLSAPYGGASYLVAHVNGIDVGRLVPVGSDAPEARTEAAHSDLEVKFRARETGFANPTEVVLRQPVPDPGLRVAVWGATAGATFGGEAAWFGTGSTWTRGTPSALTGLPTRGVPVIWMQND